MKKLLLLGAVALIAVPAYAYKITVTIPPVTIEVPDSVAPPTTGGTTTGGTTTGGTTTGGTTTGGTTTGGTTTPPAGATVDSANKTVTLAAGTEPADALIAPLAPGWTLVVQPGTYKKTLTTGGNFDGLAIKCAQTGKCVMDGQGGYGQGHRLTWGKACFHSYNNSLTIVGWKVVNCGSPQSGSSYSNESGVYLDIDDGKNTHVLTVQDSAFDNNANGVFAAGGGAVVIKGSVFGFKAPNGMNGYANGTANGPAHDMYLQTGPNGTVEVTGSYFYGSAGHNVKTRAGSTNIHDNPVMTYDGGRVADLSDGGKLTFANNGVWFRDDSNFPPRTIQSGLRAGLFGNGNMLAVGSESAASGVPSGTITGSTFNVGRVNSVIWVNNGGALTSSGNKVNYFGSGALAIQGAVTGDLSAGSAPPGSPAHAPAPPAPPSWMN